MKDHQLTPKDNNFIDSVHKLASIGVYHNFTKNPDVISFNSALANKIARKITGNVEAKVSWSAHDQHSYAGIGTASLNITKDSDVISWLDTSCSGYYFMVDYNVFFELEEDRTAFILRFSSN